MNEIHEGRLTLISKTSVARDTLKLNFSVTLPEDQAFDFKPGQFVSMEFGPTAWRAYSIASLPTESELELVVRLIEGGVASEVFREIKTGEALKFKGPFGLFGLSEQKDAVLNFCATGTGIAPFRPMILAESQCAVPRPMRLFYGGRDTEDLAYLKDLQTWNPDLEVHLGLTRQETSPDLNFKAQRITAFLETQDFTEHDEFYLCGSGPMVKSVNEVLATKNISKDNIFQERFN